MKGLRNSLMIDTISDTICDEKIHMRFMRSPTGCIQNDKMHMHSTKIVEYHCILLHGVSMQYHVAVSPHITSQVYKYSHSLDQTSMECVWSSVTK
uniref:Uncharacterized protein n=1 Tax=Glossina pallidipes TaxID=7398 RepID=A0A1A9ZRU5_GLOPL